MKEDIKLNDIVFYARILPKVGIFEVCELKVCTVNDKYFVGMDKSSKQRMLFEFDCIENNIFMNRKDALEKVLDAESEYKDQKFTETDNDLYE